MLGEGKDSVESVYPSIGNWSFDCRSHYWIERGRIFWAEQWSEAQIAYGRRGDRMAKQRQYGELDIEREQPASDAKAGFWTWLWRLLTGR